MNTSADYDQISCIERLLGKNLPKEYKDFLVLYDGARLYDYVGLDGFQLLGCNEIVKVNITVR